MMIRSTRASATRSTPHSAKGDWGRERLGAASCFISAVSDCSFVRLHVLVRRGYNSQELSQHKHQIRLDHNLG